MMLQFSPEQIEDVKRRTDVASLAASLGANLRLRGQKHVGSCPMCGGGKFAARFEVEGDHWVCAVCPDGGDAIRLMQRAAGVNFAEAVERLGGVRGLSPAEEAALSVARLANEKRRADEQNIYRQRELQAAQRIWNNTGPVRAGGVVAAYLAHRHVRLPTTAMVRETKDLPYFHGSSLDAQGQKRARAIHYGPAMVSAMINNENIVSGCHVTWLAADGLGKAKLTCPDTGEALPAKKMRGSKSGCHIVLRVPAQLTRIFMAEGIETTLAVATSLHATGRLLPTDGFWAAGDLGNLGGPAVGTIAHPTLKSSTGRPQRLPGPVPDMERPAIIVPQSVRTVVLLGDGDSERFLTETTLARGRIRYTTPTCRTVIAMAPQELDFNDMLEEVAA